MTLDDIRRLADTVLATDPRPRDMREWQDAHPAAWIHARHYYRFLYAYAREHRPKVMVELGTDHGYGAWHLARGNPRGTVVAVDLTFDRVEDGKKPENVVRVQGDSVKAAGFLDLPPIDLIVFDSAHTREHLLAEFAAYDPLCATGALQCFDDVQHDHDMREAWRSIPEPKALLNELHPAWRAGRVPGFGVRVKP